VPRGVAGRELMSGGGGGQTPAKSVGGSTRVLCRFNKGRAIRAFLNEPA